MELLLKDFKLKGFTDSFAHYFSWSNREIEICLERCMEGYCIGIYDKKQCLLGRKECTNLKIDNDDILGRALTKAIEIANIKLKDYYV